MNRIDISKLKNNSPLYIIGHSKPDVDTIFSSYLLSNIFAFLGIESYPCILEDNYQIDLYNKRIIDDYLEYKPVIIKYDDISKYNFVLVDHNDPIQSIGDRGNIILCIDHHQNVNKLNNPILGNNCANCLFIYELFKNIYSFNEFEKQLINMAIFTDTLFLKTNRYKQEDETLLKKLNTNLDNNKMLEKYFIPTDISIGINNYIKKSDRDFSYNGVMFSSSVIQLLSCDKEIVLEYENAILNKDDNHFGILRDLKNSKTYVFYKIQNNFQKNIYDYVASRTTVLKEVYNFIDLLKNKRC